MKLNYFTYCDIRYVISYYDNKIKIFKCIDSGILELEESEREVINQLLTDKAPYQYDKEDLSQILYSNEKIEKKDYMFGILKWLESIIPIHCRENFYQNLKTLELELNLDIDFNGGFKQSAESLQQCGGYNCEQNKIVVDKDSILHLWKISQTMDNATDFFWKSYSQTLLHELAHMASSYYNPETGESLCGFNKYPALEEEDKNRGLTEGMTELISMIGVPGTVEIASGYYIEVSFVNQLGLLVSYDTLTTSYFSNLGIHPLKEKLNGLGFDETKSFELFRNIELNFQLRNVSEAQTILGNIQSSLLDYLEQKCKLEILNCDGNKESLIQMLNLYEQFLITPDKLKVMRKNPNDYIGLAESVSRFQQLKNKYVMLLNSIYPYSDDKLDNKVKGFSVSLLLNILSFIMILILLIGIFCWIKY